MRRGRRILEELDRDIREHIERETQDNIERGMTPEEARYAAVRKFGNVMRVKEDTRDVWRIAWIEELWQDIRYGLRMLRNSPGFAAVAVLTLALGIGANTAIFSLIDAVMLRSLPVEKPSELVVLRWSARKAPRINGYMSSGDCPSNLRFGAANPSGCSFSEPMFREIRNTNQFSGVAAFANAGPLALTGNGPASMISGQLVSGDFFNTLGLRAAAGRVLELSDDSPTAAPVAVLNYGHWQSSFGGARDAVGRTIELNGVAFTIVGVVEQRVTGITTPTIVKATPFSSIVRSEEHTSELQSRLHLLCRLLLEKKNNAHRQTLRHDRQSTSLISHVLPTGQTPALLQTS